MMDVRNETNDTKSQGLFGGSSNVIHLGSFVCNVLFAVIIVLILFSGSDKRLSDLKDGFDRRMGEQQRHYDQELKAATDNLGTRMSSDERDDERRERIVRENFEAVDQYDDIIHSHVLKNDAMLEAHGLHPRGLPAPPNLTGE